MLVGGVELTVEQIIDFDTYPGKWSEYLEEIGIRWTRQLAIALVRARLDLPDDVVDRVLAAKMPRRDRGLRRDVPHLIAFVDAYPRRLPPRVRDVFERCIRQGRSINDCAKDLRIGRETVRRHLHRLRAIARAAG